MKKILLVVGVLVLIVAGFKISGLKFQNKSDNISGMWQKIVTQISQDPFWKSQKVLNPGVANPSNKKEYQQEILSCVNDFSNKIYSYQRQGGLLIVQFMNSNPKSIEEGVQFSKDVQTKMLKIANDISKMDFPKEVVIKGKRYDLKDEKIYTEQIKDNYIKGFKLAAEGYSHITSFFETQNPKDIDEMRDSFAEADKYFFKGMDGLKILEGAYGDLINNKQYKDLQ